MRAYRGAWTTAISERLSPRPDTRRVQSKLLIKIELKSDLSIQGLSKQRNQQPARLKGGVWKHMPVTDLGLLQQDKKLEKVSFVTSVEVETGK